MAYFQGCLRSGTVVFLTLPNPLGDASLRLCRVTLGQQPPVILDVHVVGAAERSETPRKRRARSATNDRQSRRAIGWPACVSGMQVAALTLIASQEASAQEAPAEPVHASSFSGIPSSSTSLLQLHTLDAPWLSRRIP